MRLLWIAGIALALTGCETMQQTRGPSMTDDPSQACFAALASAPELQVLTPRVGALGDAKSANLEQMNSKAVPSDEEKLALSFWAVQRKACLDQGHAFRVQYAPAGYNVTIENAQYRLIGEISKLYGGESNWGQFVSKRMQLATQTEAEIEAVRTRHMQAVAAEDAANRAATAQFINSLQQQQQIQQMNRPRTTNCYRIGSSVNCTTY